MLVVTIRVDVEAGVDGPNSASVSGGGAVSASVSDPVTVSTASPEYGVAQGGLLSATSTTQAGGHPNLTNEFFLNTVNPVGENRGNAGSLVPGELLISEPPEQPKDISFDLPKVCLVQRWEWRAARWPTSRVRRTVPATR